MQRSRPAAAARRDVPMVWGLVPRSGLGVELIQGSLRVECLQASGSHLHNVTSRKRPRHSAVTG